MKHTPFSNDHATKKASNECHPEQHSAMLGASHGYEVFYLHQVLVLLAAMYRYAFLPQQPILPWPDVGPALLPSTAPHWPVFQTKAIAIADYKVFEPEYSSHQSS